MIYVVRRAISWKECPDHVRNNIRFELTINTEHVSAGQKGVPRTSRLLIIMVKVSSEGGTEMSPSESVEQLVASLSSDREPFHPGTIIKDEYLDELDMTQKELSERMGVPYARVNELIKVNGCHHRNGADAFPYF